MRSIIKAICLTIGRSISWATPIVKYINMLCLYVYTGYKRHAFKKVGDGTLISPYCTRIEGGEVGSGCTFGCGLWLSEIHQYGNIKYSPTLKIGNNCKFGEFNHIAAINYIEIGNGVLTGQYVLIEDHSHGMSDISSTTTLQPSKRELVSKGTIIIEDNVWLGDKVAVLAGVKIGKGSIIGANSVVTHDIPPFTVAVGAPAKVIRKLDSN